MTAVWTASALDGGDTGRVADRGREPVSFASVVGFVGVVAAIGPLLATVVVFLPAEKPVKTGLGAGGTSAPIPGVVSVLSSFWRFAAGSSSCVVAVAEDDDLIRTSEDS